MKKLITTIVFSLLILQLSFAQESIPTIRSNKQEVLLKFNNDSIVWRIEPEKNPDIFYIGSTLKTKHVWFITDVDSLYFNIEAGKKYDFIVQYNNQN
ncbi:MAG: hypothetical protein WCP74_13445, partial [Sphingobacteriia bacterium]